MLVKALSVRGPYAHMIAIGMKPIETRTWWTSYRGPLLIVASKRPPFDLAGQALALTDLVDCRPMTKADEEKACCSIYPNAHSLVLDNIEALEPFPVRGQLGLFDIEMPVMHPRASEYTHRRLRAVVREALTTAINDTLAGK